MCKAIKISKTTITKCKALPKNGFCPHHRKSKNHRALLIIDMQNDFINGSLTVKSGDKIISKINKLHESGAFDVIVLSKDWHPVGHVSFQSTHKKDPAAVLFQPYQLPTGATQVLWPDHCVQGSHGAEIHADIITNASDIIQLKGTNPNVDSYSAFFDNDHKSETGLHKKLQSRGVNEVFVCGLAYDYCVGSTAIDAAQLGYKTHVILPASKAVAAASKKDMTSRLLKNKVNIITKLT